MEMDTEFFGPGTPVGVPEDLSESLRMMLVLFDVWFMN
jgi:hypothetical protein